MKMSEFKGEIIGHKNTKSVKQLVEENKNRKAHKTVNVGVGTGNGLKKRKKE